MSLDLQGRIWKFGRCLVAHHGRKFCEANLQSNFLSEMKSLIWWEFKYKTATKTFLNNLS